MPQTVSLPSFPADARSRAEHWLFEAALPLWWERGADHAGGGFHEKIGQDGKPIGSPSRVRVQARQTYVYARAGALGWSGPWQAAMRHGLAFMLERYRRPDGFFRSTLDTADQSVDLYDQAFVLFALAHAYAAEGRPPALRDTALVLLRRIEDTLGLAEGGYRDGLPAQPVLRANPLMHLFEALLAWVDAGGGDEFRAPAVALCTLGAERLVDPAVGALGECFDAGWTAPAATPQVYEPGHQFEWAWLFLQAGPALGAQTRAQALLIEDFARRFGIDNQRQVAIFALDRHGAATDRRARLWAQTERLRTSLLFAAQGLETETHLAAAAASFATLQRFLDTPVAGLWHEWQDENGRFESAPAPASSLYHLMTGLSELLQPAPVGIDRTR